MGHGFNSKLLVITRGYISSYPIYHPMVNIAYSMGNPFFQSNKRLIAVFFVDLPIEDLPIEEQQLGTLW